MLIANLTSKELARPNGKFCGRRRCDAVQRLDSKRLYQSDAFCDKNQDVARMYAGLLRQCVLCRQGLGFPCGYKPAERASEQFRIVLGYRYLDVDGCTAARRQSVVKLGGRFFFNRTPRAYLAIRRSRSAVFSGRTPQHGNGRTNEVRESSEQTVTRRCLCDPIDHGGVNSSDVVQMMCAGLQNHRRLVIRWVDTEPKVLVERKSRNVHELSLRNG